MCKDCIPITLYQLFLRADKPKFHCPRTAVAPDMGKNINISCRVSAEPPIQNMSFFYTREVKDKANVTIVAGDRYGHYVTEAYPTVS